jgi:hypothetical protein
MYTSTTSTKARGGFLSQTVSIDGEAALEGRGKEREKRRLAGKAPSTSKKL